MNVFVKLYSNYENEILSFLKHYYGNVYINHIKNTNKPILEWEKEYNNPIEIADIIGVFIDNNDKYKINMWICLDKDFLINITSSNVNQIIKYLYERFPY